MFLTTSQLQQMRGRFMGDGQVVILPTLAPGTIVEQVIKTPLSSARSTAEVDIIGSQSKVLDRVPWPHKFFRSFMTAPKVEVGPFYQGYNFSDPALVKMGYFKNPGPQTDVDMAEYLYANQEAVNNHFIACVQEVIKEQEEKVKEAKKKAKEKEIITIVISVIAGLLTFGAGTVVVIALTCVQLATTAWQVYSMKTASADQLHNVTFMMKYLNVSPLDFDKFRVWITSLVSTPPEAPPTPTAITVNSTYTVFKNGDYVLQDNDAIAALSRIYGLTMVGDRLTVKDEVSKSVYRVYLRTKDGLQGIPPEQAHLVQSLPAAQAEQMASGAPVEVAAQAAVEGSSWMTPALLLAIPAALWMTRK